MIPYKTNKSSLELEELMFRALNKEASERETHSDKISEGLNYLAEAATILEGLKNKHASEAITLIIEKMAGK